MRYVKAMYALSVMCFGTPRHGYNFVVGFTGKPTRWQRLAMFVASIPFALRNA
jgi:hypothetical protein